jgi:FkbM family methyltransferase
MDVIGGLIRVLDDRRPMVAARMQWRRDRRSDVALRVVDALVARGDTVLDIGAMRGSFSARMLDLVGPQGVVHAFEPNPAHHAHLRSLPRLCVHPVALSDHDGTAELAIPVTGGVVSSGLASLVNARGFDARTVTVPVRRLDDMDTGPGPIAFIKCDVEGHEDAVIEGGRGILERDCPPLLIEIEQRHRGTDPARAFDTLHELGYRGYALFPGGLRDLAEFDVARDQLDWLSETWAGGVAPIGYVHNFLFVSPQRDVTALIDRQPGRPLRAAERL